MNKCYILFSHNTNNRTGDYYKNETNIQVMKF